MYNSLKSHPRFAINATSGEIFVATDKGCNCTRTECDDSDLNWEKNPVYYITAVAQDGGGSRSPVSVEIHLLDINDNAPQFIYSKYETSIKENSTTFSSGDQQIFVQVLLKVLKLNIIYKSFIVISFTLKKKTFIDYKIMYLLRQRIEMRQIHQIVKYLIALWMTMITA